MWQLVEFAELPVGIRRVPATAYGGWIIMVFLCSRRDEYDGHESRNKHTNLEVAEERVHDEV